MSHIWKLSVTFVAIWPLLLHIWCPWLSSQEDMLYFFLEIAPVSQCSNIASNVILPCFQFSSVAQSCPTICDPMNCSTPGLPVYHQLLEFTQTHVHRVGDSTQLSHPLSSPFPPAPNPSQHQSLFQWDNSSHEVAKVLEFKLQHQSLQWTPRTDLL